MKNRVDDVRYSKSATKYIKSCSPKEKDRIRNAKFVLAWDPDFTKLTEEEKRILEQSDQEMRSGEYFSEQEVWG